MFSLFTKTFFMFSEPVDIDSFDKQKTISLNLEKYIASEFGLTTNMTKEYRFLSIFKVNLYNLVLKGTKILFTYY